MPRASRIESPKTRRAVISTLMALLLVCSLGLAYVYVHRRGPAKLAISDQMQAIGRLIVPLPEGWQIVQSDSDDRSPTTALTIASRRRPQWTITFRELPTGPRRAPVSVLRELLSTDSQMLANAERRSMMPFRGGALVGMAMVTKSGDGEHPRRQIVAVMTLDGQTYWSMQLSNSAGTEAQGDADAALRDLRLLEAIAQGASFKGYRPATSADWIAADLPPTSLPNGFDAWRSTDPLSSPVILLTPRDEQRWLRLIRIRGTPDTGATETESPYSPTSALLQQTLFLNSGAGRPSMAVVKIAGAQVIQSSIDLPGNDELKQLLAMATLGSGWTVTMDVVLDLDPNLTSNRLIEQLLSRMVAAAGKSPNAADKTWTAMLQHGERLAREHREQWNSLTQAGATYHLLERGDTLMGARVNEIQAPRVADSLTRQGHWKLWFGMDPSRPRIEQKWTSTTDGNNFSVRTLRPFARVERPVTPKAGTNAKPIQGVIETLSLEGGILRQLQEEAGGQRVLWTMPMPASYLHPVGEDVWPMKAWVTDDNKVRESMGVVWISRDRQPPSPCLIHASAMPEAQGDNVPPDARILLRIRPLAAVDDDVVVLDAQGRMIGSRWQTAAEPVALRRVTREQLLQSLPWMANHVSMETKDASNQ